MGRPEGGKAGPFVTYGRVLRERRQSMPGLDYSQRTQTAMADRLGVSQSFLGRLERGFENLPNYDLSWFERVAPNYGWTTEEMLQALGIPIVKGANRNATGPQAALAGTNKSFNVDGYVLVDVHDATEDARVVDRRPVPAADASPTRRFYRVRGDGMAPNILDGEDVAVDSSAVELEDGGVYLVAAPGEAASVKRARVIRGEWWLLSDHPDVVKHPPDRVPHGLVVRGRVARIYPPSREPR